VSHYLDFAKRLLPATAGAAAITMGIAQSQVARPPAFEVASVRASKTEDFRRIGMQFLPGGRFVTTNLPVLFVIATAYNVPFQSPRLSGGPDWIRSDRFDIEATAEKGAFPAGATAKNREDKMRLMLQALLAERFKLTIRREMKEQPVYAMVVAKSGSKLQKAKVEEKDCSDDSAGVGISCHTFLGGQGRGLHARAVDMADLALYVSNWTERPVVDQTGIEGLFEIETKGWATLRPGPAPPPGAKAEDGSDLASLPSIFTVFADMGLKLEPQRAPVEMFVIEHVEKPSEN